MKIPDIPNKVVVGLVGLAALATVATACSGLDKISEPYNDAPRGKENNGPADIITFPDGFSNVAAKCDGTTRVYSAFHSDSAYAAIAVVGNHPACGGGQK